MQKQKTHTTQKKTNPQNHSIKIYNEKDYTEKYSI